MTMTYIIHFTIVCFAAIWMVLFVLSASFNPGVVYPQRHFFYLQPAADCHQLFHYIPAAVIPSDEASQWWLLAIPTGSFLSENMQLLEHLLTRKSLATRCWDVTRSITTQWPLSINDQQSLKAWIVVHLWPNGLLQQRLRASIQHSLVWALWHHQVFRSWS